MTNCWFCQSEMVWNSDFTFEDYGYENDGIVAVLSCSNENCRATANFMTKFEEDNINIK